jgi:hypothetical protein
MAGNEVLTNLEAVGDMVGAFLGISEGLTEQAYMDGLIRQAHGKASNAFNMAAVATARAGALSHVFEFGTEGITRGPGKYPDGTDPRARLWIHTLTGPGGTKDIGYTFRPAKERNPQPTTADTGVASKYLSRLSKRKYVFWNKAYVMETGRPVAIRAKNSDFLFVPFYGEPPTDPSYTRGFLMWDSKRYGPIINRPGRSTKGSFTKFWMGWWASEGGSIMQTEMEKSVTMDIEKVIAEMGKKMAAESMKPVEAVNIAATAASSKSFFGRLFSAANSKRRSIRTR